MNKMLVSIATYKDKNFKYLNQVIDEYKSYKNYDVTVHIHGTDPMPRNDVNVILHDNPKNTVFFHRQEFVNEQDNYDLFLFSEDDILVKEESITTFCHYSNVLPTNYSLGFLRFEKRSVDDPNDNIPYFIDIWPHVGHISQKNIEINGNTYFTLTNQHQGCSLLSKQGLKIALTDSNYLKTDYSGLESGASGVYTGWQYSTGVITKVHTQNINDLKHCLVQHLSNRHVNGQPPFGIQYALGCSNFDSIVSDISK